MLSILHGLYNIHNVPLSRIYGVCIHGRGVYSPWYMNVYMFVRYLGQQISLIIEQYLGTTENSISSYVSLYVRELVCAFVRACVCNKDKTMYSFKHEEIVTINKRGLYTEVDVNHFDATTARGASLYNLCNISTDTIHSPNTAWEQYEGRFLSQPKAIIYYIYFGRY